MKIFDRYLKKLSVPLPELDIATHQYAICIPAYDEKDIKETLKSLALNRSVDFNLFAVYICLNHSEDDVAAKEIHAEQKQLLEEYLEDYPIKSCLLHIEMPKKKAGVGFARKHVMDCAISAFYKQKQGNGYLIALDADCVVSDNYLSEIVKHFDENPQSPAASVAFKHQRTEVFPGQKRAITKYEMHLRLYRMWQQFCGHPYAHHTVGSAMICSAEAYVKQGGMNTKKAGEDFYFLNKLMHLGDFTDITKARVYPQSRVSTRVPFGTGRAMQQALDGSEIKTYNPDIFFHLKWLFLEMRSVQPRWEKLSPQNQAIIQSMGIKQAWEVVNANTNSADNFKKRLFQHFDLFQLMKMVHEMRDQFFPNVSVEESYLQYCQLFQTKSVLDLEAQYEHLFKLDIEALNSKF